MPGLFTLTCMRGPSARSSLTNSHRKRGTQSGRQGPICEATMRWEVSQAEQPPDKSGLCAVSLCSPLGSSFVGARAARPKLHGADSWGGGKWLTKSCLEEMAL